MNVLKTEVSVFFAESFTAQPSMKCAFNENRFTARFLVRGAVRECLKCRLDHKTVVFRSFAICDTAERISTTKAALQVRLKGIRSFQKKFKNVKTLPI